MPLLPKNVVYFGFFTNEMECERGKQDFSNRVIVLNATINYLLFQYKNTRETSFKNSMQLIYFNYHKVKSENCT